MDDLTLGSLFDGSGGFPLGGLLCGITPVWASEIEPFPIRVTTKRLPYMKHYGDVSAINGAELPPVDIITFGSPCTDMSVAGKRAGLEGKQSVLFHQAIRIIKEMRRKTNGKYPRYAVWENVPGAFSSNKGADFKAVIDAFVQIIEPEAEVPAPENGRWPYADIYLGDGWSVAYRTVDAQFFGVAQRRRRVYAVASFADECAGEILFKSEGMSGYTPQSRQSRQGTAGDASPGTGDAISFELGGHTRDELTGTLRADMGDNQTTVALEHHPHDCRVRFDDSGQIQTLTSRMGTGGMNVPLVMESSESLKAYGICSDGSNSMKSDNPHSGVYEADTSRTLDQSGGNPSCNQGGIAVVSIQGSMIGRSNKNGPQGDGVNEGICFTLNTADRHAVVYAMTVGGYTEVNEEKTATLMARDYKDPQIVSTPQPASFYPQMKAESQCFRRDGTANTIVNGTNPGFQNGIVDTEYAVRRLIPTECALLQGFPMDWCSDLGTKDPTKEDIVFWTEVFETHRKIMGKTEKPKSRSQIIKWLHDPYSDAAEYKMWGNGVALPCVCFVLAGITWAAKKDNIFLRN